MAYEKIVRRTSAGPIKADSIDDFVAAIDAVEGYLGIEYGGVSVVRGRIEQVVSNVRSAGGSVTDTDMNALADAIKRLRDVEEFLEIFWNTAPRNS